MSTPVGLGVDTTEQLKRVARRLSAACDEAIAGLEASGAVAHIDAANTTARVTLADGATFSVVEDEAAASLRRELQEAGGATSRRLLLSEDEMQSHHRRLCAMSSGSFTMMASSTVFRRLGASGGALRRLGMYSCALMTSGSFTMMASGGLF